jgi:hypothetical protein
MGFLWMTMHERSPKRSGTASANESMPENRKQNPFSVYRRAVLTF